MPIVTSGKVLVSGASGFIAAWVVKKLLDSGYSVRGTVRSASKGEYLKKQFAEYGDKFEYFVVDDIAKSGAFDKAVIGVDVVAHTASPVTLTADDPNDLIIPAVNGTVGMLESVAKNGKNVKRVVLTSSCAAIMELVTPLGTLLSENNWNGHSLAEVNKKGKDAGGMDKYQASKVLAEKAAWKFMEDNEGKLSWDLAILNPPFVFGPIIQDVSSPDKINASVYLIYAAMQGQLPNEELIRPMDGWVDVRDIAQAHVLAAQVQAAAGRRIIICAGEFAMQDFLDAIVAAGISVADKGSPGAGKLITTRTRYDTSVAQDVFKDLKYISLEQCAKDTASAIRERGW